MRLILAAAGAAAAAAIAGLLAFPDPRGRALALAVAGAAALAAAVAAVSLARRLDHLGRAARRLAAGDRAARAPERPADPLGAAGRSLNRLADEARESSAALSRERDEIARLLLHLNDGIALLTPEGRLERCSERLARLLEVPFPPAPGADFAGWVRTPAFDDLLAGVAASNAPAEAELRLWTPLPRLVHARAVPLPPPRAAILLVVRDLSENESLTRVRQDLVANLSHDLRTPLTALRGYAETLLEGGLDDPENREGFVRVIRDSAVRLQALVEDMLSLAELERPGLRPRRETFDLRESAERQVEAFRAAADRAGIGLTLEPGAPVRVAGERQRIEQALANLLDNAVKYTERGGVRVAVGEDASGAWCEVADTGEGIASEHLPRIFERFYRGDPARSREKDGTGLGLSIVKHVVALHGGEVAVESAPGRGSRFRFRLPRS